MRRRGPVPQPGGMAEEVRTLRLEIFPGPGPLHGRLVPGSGPALEFAGWLQLLDVLAEVIEGD
jgi:hypothetical protein